MRRQTASKIVAAYERWRDAKSGTQEFRAAKETLDELMRSATREEIVERAHDRLGMQFKYVGRGEEWPRAGESIGSTLDPSNEDNGE